MEDQMKNMHLDPDPTDADQPPSNDLSDIIEDVGAEYQMLDSTLDQINAQLDVMEQQNDDLYAKFQDLLESSRQTRQELEAARLADGQSGSSGQNEMPTDKVDDNSSNPKDSSDAGS